MARNHLLLEKGDSQFHRVAAQGDFFLEFTYAPQPRTSTFTQGIPLVTMRTAEGNVVQILQEQGRLVLGDEVATYPLYHAGALPKRLKADLHQILIQCVDGVLTGYVDGFPMETHRQQRTPFSLSEIAAHAGVSSLRLSSGRIPHEEVRLRYLAFSRGKRIARALPNPSVTLGRMGIDAPFMTELPMRNSIPNRLNRWEKEPVRLYATRKGDSLVFRWSIETGKPIEARKLGGRDKGLWNVESVELYLLPPGETTPYQFIVSAANELYDAHGEDTTWNGDISHSARSTPRGWEGELVISATKSGLPSLKPKGEWKMDFFSGSAWRAWSPAGQFNDTKRYGTLRFQEDAPVVSFLGITDGRIQGELLSQRKCTVRIALDAFATGEVEPERQECILKLESGRKTDFSLALPDCGKEDGDYTLWILEENGTPLFQQSFLK